MHQLLLKYFLFLICINVFFGLVPKHAFANNNTNRQLKKAEWEKLTKDVDYQDDIKKVNKQKDRRTQKSETPKPSIKLPFFNLGSMAQILLIVAVALLILFFVSRFAMQNTANQKVEQLIISTEEAEDKLLETDVDFLLRNAIAKQDWRTALRLYYLKTLKTLHHFHYIDWKREKTNYQYNAELAQWQLLPDWKNVTSQYERTWYGERPIEQLQFSDQEKRIQQILQFIQTTPPAKS